ncbi:hypothetical protein GT045_15580 [Streptomyces sp. SID486]|uniref:hypothetical protein n=1 Tax=unclassified Streptomyces TaxID=2593676 RepID=UPI00136EC5DF|nr:hypothetical protein [Streptomyces sp. SID486]MYW19066.1 hypothetical protein [Streptomyces sp. SID2955]MYX96193.1 hypothetical protein [Streptomyces sp. SID486]
MSDTKKAADAKPLDNHMPSEPVADEKVGTLDDHGPAETALDAVKTMDNHMPAPPALGLDAK